MVFFSCLITFSGSLWLEEKSLLLYQSHSTLQNEGSASISSVFFHSAAKLALHPISHGPWTQIPHSWTTAFIPSSPRLHLKGRAECPASALLLMNSEDQPRCLVSEFSWVSVFMWTTHVNIRHRPCSCHPWRTLRATWATHWVPLSFEKVFDLRTLQLGRSERDTWVSTVRVEP